MDHEHAHGLGRYENRLLLVMVTREGAVDRVESSRESVLVSRALVPTRLIVAAPFAGGGGPATPFAGGGPPISSFWYHL
jgi:hypothetical protein